jgi:hypothetical protein
MHMYIALASSYINSHYYSHPALALMLAAGVVETGEQAR